MITSRDGRAWLINIWADATPPTVGPKSKIPPKIKLKNSLLTILVLCKSLKSFGNEDRVMTGNGSYVNLLNLA